MQAEVVVNDIEICAFSLRKDRKAKFFFLLSYKISNVDYYSKMPTVLYAEWLYPVVHKFTRTERTKYLSR